MVGAIYKYMPSIHSNRDKRISIKMELQIRKKCMEVNDFPSQEIIDEFKQAPIVMDNLNLKWKQPDLVKFLVSHN